VVVVVVVTAVTPVAAILAAAVVVVALVASVPTAVALMTVTRVPHVMAVVTKTTTRAVALPSQKAAATNARVVLMTASPASEMTVLHLVEILVPVTVVPPAVISALHVVTSAHHAVTLQPVSLLLASPRSPSPATGVRYLCPATLKNGLPRQIVK
jgi:hypothetical protein